MNQPVLLALVVVGAAGAGFVGGIALSEPSGSAVPSSSTDVGPELVELRLEVEGTRADLRTLSETLANLERSQSSLARKVDSIPAATIQVAAEEGEDPSPANLQTMVSAVLAEERRVRDEEREAQREEFRTRMDERRQEQEALAQGPYDRYNTKINSLGTVLGMTGSQKDAYFAALSSARERLDEGMKSLREQSGNSEGQEDGESRRGRRGSREGREQYRQLEESIQQQFVAEIEQMLSGQQLELYNELSSDAKSFRDRDQVYAPGEEPRRAFGRGGSTDGRTFGGFGGNTGGFGGGRGRGGRGRG